MTDLSVHFVRCVGVSPIRPLKDGATRKLIFATDQGQVEVNLYSDEAEKLLLPEEVATGSADGLDSLPLVTSGEALTQLLEREQVAVANGEARRGYSLK